MIAGNSDILNVQVCMFLECTMNTNVNILFVKLVCLAPICVKTLCKIINIAGQANGANDYNFHQQMIRKSQKT